MCAVEDAVCATNDAMRATQKTVHAVEDAVRTVEAAQTQEDEKGAGLRTDLNGCWRKIQLALQVTEARL